MTSANRAERLREQASEIQWDDPTPLRAERAIPPFPTGVLPRPVAAMAAAVAEFAQVDEAMSATSGLSMLAAAVAGKARIRIRPGWSEPLNLYTVTVAGPGQRKSAVQRSMAKPLYEAEKTLVEQGEPERIERETQYLVAKKAAENSRNKAGGADGASRDEATAEAVSQAMAAERTTVPPRLRLVADDATAEAVASILAEQGRLAIVSTEGGPFDMMAGRYTSNKAVSLDVWLKGHSGDPIRVDRKGRAPEFVDEPALTLALMVQPMVLEEIGKNPALRGRGLLARCLYALPPSKVGRRSVDPPEVPREVATAYAERLTDLALRCARREETATLVLDPEAQRLFIEHAQRLEPSLDPAGPFGHVTEWGSKLEGAIARIAGLLHLGDDPLGGFDTPVAAATVRCAQLIGECYYRHALVAFDRMSGERGPDRAAYLLSVVARMGEPIVSARDLHAHGSRSQFPEKQDLTTALDTLTDHGYLTELVDEEAHAGRRGRPPSKRYAVHPKVLSGATETTETTEPPRPPLSVVSVAGNDDFERFAGRASKWKARQ